jgi:glucose-1-phosphate cytidylyltransferase
MNYFMHMSDITVDLSNGGIKVHNSKAENWKVTLVDTGLDTMTGGRIKRIKDHLNGERFMLTYGDGVGDVNINSLAKFHESHGKLATMTAVQPSGRFGALKINDDQKVESFVEKPAGDGAWINGGFFVLEPQVIDYIKDDNTIWEREPLENLTKESQLFAYKHEGFWKPMDTLRDKIELEKLWSTKEAPWKVW